MRMPLGKICPCGVMLLLVFVAKAGAWQLSFPQDTIAYNDKFNNRQSVAFDSQGRIHVVYSGQFGTTSTTREIYYATDSTSTFRTRTITSNAVDDNYPTIVVDRNDDVHVGFLGRDAGNLFQVQYTRMIGDSFTTPVFITQGGVSKATPYCAIGRDSVLHFVYHTLPTSGTQYAYYRSYDLRSSTLSAEQQLVAASVTGDFDAAVATDTSGFVHIVVKSGSASGGPLKYYTNRTGSLVETPTGVVGNVDYPRLLVDKRNVVHILYRATSSLTLNVLSDAAGTFGVPVPITPPGQRPSGYHNFAVDNDGRIFVVYQSSVSASGKGWYLVHGKDVSFSDTIQVFDLPPGYVTRNTSAIAARGTGEIAVTYSPGASRSGSVVCDIFVKRGRLETTSVQSDDGHPALFSLGQSFPNPFNPTTTIRFSLGQSATVALAVYDMLGRQVRVLLNEPRVAGTHAVLFDATGLASGVYFYRMQTGTFSHVRRFVLLR